MLGIGGTEFIIILFFGFLIFGPEKLPQMGRTVGRAIRQFREASDSMSQKIKTEVTDPFQEAISPYKDEIEEFSAPMKEDIAAINQTIQDTKSAITDPLKGALDPTPRPKNKPVNPVTGGTVSGGQAAKPAAAAGAAAAGAKAAGKAAEPAKEEAPAATPASDDDPFANVLNGTPDEAAETPAQAAAEASGSGIAASLYGLDDAEDGE